MIRPVGHSCKWLGSVAHLFPMSLSSCYPLFPTAVKDGQLYDDAQN